MFSLGPLQPWISSEDKVGLRWEYPLLLWLVVECWPDPSHIKELPVLSRQPGSYTVQLSEL